MQTRLPLPLAEVCSQAALQARRKAEAYASALGVKLGPVVRVADPGTAAPQFAMPVAAPAAQMARSGGPEAAPLVAVDPGTMDLSAAVEVTFRLEQ